MINIYSQSGQVTYGIKYYTVDTEDEKNSLPTKDKMGSKCYVIESETWYILNGNEEWVPFVGEDSTADAILISIKNMSAEQKDQLKEELDINNTVLYTQQTLTAAQQAQARTNIGAVSLDEIGRVFRLKGSVPTVGDLPVSGNYVGDVYYVESVSAGYIWLISDSQPNGYWEELGETFDITVDSKLSTTSGNPVQNKAIASALNELRGSMDALVEMLDESKQDKSTVVTVEGSTPTITPAANTVYHCGELTSLTINNPPATGKYSIVFFSGATATTTVGIENFAAEANKRYKITVEDNYATYDSWPYTPTQEVRIC